MPGPQYRGKIIQLICPSLQQAKKYQVMAEKAGVPLSKFLLSVIEDGLAEKTAIPRARLSQESKELLEENHELREELRVANLLVSKYEGELRQLQQAAFLGESFEGERVPDARIIEALLRGPFHDYRLLEILWGIGQGEKDQIQAVQRPLEVLELHELIKKTNKGWQWIKK
jgi:hypothetical protein